MFPIAHIAFPLLLLSIYDKIQKGKPRIPNIYFIIIGFAGILPDLLAIHLWAEGRMAFSHSIFFPLIFLAAYLILRNKRPLYKDISLLLFIGTLSHLILDVIVAPLWPLYPLNTFELKHLVLFPAHGITLDGIIYANFIEHAIWYAFDALFFILFVLSEKTAIVEKICQKLRSTKH